MFPRNSSNYSQSCQPSFISVSALLSKPDSLKYTDGEVISIEQLKKIQLDVLNEQCGKACEDKGIISQSEPDSTVASSNIYFSN